MIPRTVISVFNTVLLEGNLGWVRKAVLTIKINFWLHFKVFQLVQTLGCKSESMAHLFRDIIGQNSRFDLPEDVH